MKQVFKDPQLQESLEKHGFVKLQLLGDSELQNLKGFYESTPFEIPESDFFSTMHINNPDYRKAVDDHIKSIVLPHVGKLMLDHKILFANYLFKKPSSNSLVGIHQDWTYIDEDEHSSVNMWVPMIDTYQENGGLAVLNGSHRLKTPVRYTPFEEPVYKDCLDLIESKSVTQPVKQGEAFIYYSNLLHFSTPNTTDQERLSMNMVIIPKKAQPIHFHKSNGQVEKYLIDDRFYHHYKLYETPQGYEKDSLFQFTSECFTREELQNL